MKFRQFFTLKTSKKSENDAVVAVGSGTIAEAYNHRYKEIESLRKYDRGEKKIIAPNIRDIVRSI